VTSDCRGLVRLGLHNVFGAVLDGELIKEAARGCRVIIHRAGLFIYRTQDPAEIINTSVKGAGNVIRAPWQHGLGRVVYTISMYAVGWVLEKVARLTGKQPLVTQGFAEEMIRDSIRWLLYQGDLWKRVSRRLCDLPPDPAWPLNWQ
jgi:nucleoside-diphosphate-sugar epimerase